MDTFGGLPVPLIVYVNLLNIVDYDRNLLEPQQTWQPASISQRKHIFLTNQSHHLQIKLHIIGQNILTPHLDWLKCNRFPCCRKLPRRADTPAQSERNPGFPLRLRRRDLRARAAPPAPPRVFRCRSPFLSVDLSLLLMQCGLCPCSRLIPASYFTSGKNVEKGRTTRSSCFPLLPTDE